MNHTQANLKLILNWGNKHSKKLLIGCLLLATGLRIWGLNYGLPFIYHPDEVLPVNMAQRMLKTGDFNPHFFHWPSLLFYINLLAYSLHYLIGNLLGIFQTVADIPSPIMLAMGTGKMPMPDIWMMSRTITMIFGLGVVVLVFLSSKELTGKTIAGGIAGLLLAVSPTNVIHSRFITPDMMATFLIMLSFYSSIKVWKTGQNRYYILTGIATGLAISAKYNAALILVTFVLAHYWRYGLSGIKRKEFYLTPFLMVVTFFATTPYAILDYPTFLEGIQFNKQHYSTGHFGMEGNTLSWYLSYLWRVEGIVFVLAIIEIVRGIFTRSKSVLFTALFPVIYFIFINTFIVRNDRTILPMIPFIIMLTASLIVWAYEKLSNQKGSRTVAWAVIGITLLVAVSIALPLQRTLRNNINLTTIDGRETSRIWIEENIPAGTKFAIDSYSPYLEPNQYTSQHFNPMLEESVDWYRDNGYEYLIFSEGSYGHFYHDPDRYSDIIADYELMFDSLNEIKIFDDGNLEIRLYAVP